jgi:hypothetical protein
LLRALLSARLVTYVRSETMYARGSWGHTGELFLSGKNAPGKTRGKCGARTRRGTACLCKGVGRGGRCKFHGGASTGPKTEAGKARISALQRARWKRWREDREAIEAMHLASAVIFQRSCAEACGPEAVSSSPVVEETAGEPKAPIGGNSTPRRSHLHLPRFTVNPGRDRYGRGHK